MEKSASLARPTFRRGERGSVLVYTVLSLLFLFLAIGLGVDLSHLYSVKTELQNAADSAALAGASALLLPAESRIATAVDRAVETLNKNKYDFNNEQFDEVMTKTAQRDLIEFAVNLDGPYYKESSAATMSNIRFVKVTTPTVPVNVFFSIPILGLSRTMSTTATSGLSVNSNVFCNYVPIAVIEGAFGGGVGWLDTSGDGVRDYEDDCKPPAGAPSCDPNTRFCPGCKYKMVAGPGAWQDTSPGNYQALDAGAGAHDLKMAIAGGTSNCLTSNDEAEFITETEPGRMTGPIAKGINTRFDIYKNSDCPPGINCSNFGGANVTINGITKPVEEWFPPDTNVYAGAGPPPPSKGKGPPAGGGPPGAWNYSGIWNFEYVGATEEPPLNFKKPTHDAVPHRREVFMPIINQSEFDPGKDEVKFTKVGKFFLNKFVDEGNKAIFVEYIGPAFGAGGFDPAGGSDAPVVVPVLYR
jgi:Flp pilus assembly protein TadG